MCKGYCYKLEGVGCFVSLPLSSLKQPLVWESSFEMVKKLFDCFWIAEECSLSLPYTKLAEELQGKPSPPYHDYDVFIWELLQFLNR